MSSDAAGTRAAGFYWVRDAVVRANQTPVVCEWYARDPASCGFWLYPGSEQDHDDSEFIIIAGPLDSPSLDAPRVQRSEPGGYAEPTPKKRD